jgi:DNA-directed RNA polymerase subunit M
MAMEFCPKCGTRLVPKRPKEGSKSSAVLACPKCGFKKKLVAKQIETIQKVIEHSPQETIAVISKEEQKLRVLPTVRVECPKCGNNLAYVWQVQTRGSDESSTQFFRCTKCNHTFREYS